MEALDLQPGQSVLDCTLGLGTDALVCSYVVGELGQVVGLEINPLMAALVARGLQYYQTPEEKLKAALRRIQVIKADYSDFISNAPEGSFDAVYFDPMFRQPLDSSSGISPLRSLADHRPVEPWAIARARQVAKRRVVMKERAGSGELARLGFTRFIGSKSSRVVYGYLVNGEEQQ